MANTNGSSNINAWWLFGISAAGMAVFAALYFFNPKTTIQTQTVTNSITNTVTQFATNTITNVVVKEVPKEVEKIVAVPAEIPQKYITAAEIISNFDNSSFVEKSQLLFGMKDVNVAYRLTDEVKQSVSEDDVRAKFELTLRKNNVPISPTSKNRVTLTVEGFWGEPPFQNILIFTLSVCVFENQTLLRGGQSHRGMITVWSTSKYGMYGNNKAERSLLDEVERQGELFSNDFLSANPKQ